MSSHDLIGRDDALTRVLEALPSEALVTLRGPGGVGKTTLSRAVAAATEALFVELDGCHSYEDAVAALAAALPDEVPASDFETICTGLADAGVVILDNAEHIVDEVARLVRSLLDADRHPRLLVTSREPLRLPEEVVVDLTPLAEEDGEALFELRAREVLSDFEVGPENRSAVRDILRLVDGLPLAIELAAARVRILTPAMIAERIERRMQLLRSKTERVERHATLDACVGWSFDLLDPKEQSVLEQIAIFRGRFGIRDAEEVVEVEEWVGDTLESLVEKSLLRIERAGQVEFVPYEGVRRFVQQRTEFDADLVRRYARHFETRMSEPDVGAAELRDVIHAWELARLLDFGVAVDLLIAARQRLTRGGYLPRVFQMIDEALVHPDLDRRNEALLQACLASCHYACMDFEAMAEALDRAEELTREGDWPEIRARIILTRAVRLHELDRAEEAEERLAVAREFIDRVSPELRTHILGASGLAAVKRRANAEAIRYLERAVNSARLEEQFVLEARASSWCALAYFADGQHARGVSYLESTLDMFDRVNDSVSKAQTMLTLAQAVSREDPERSKKLAYEAREAASRSGLRYQAALCDILIARHDPSPAAVPLLRKTLSTFTHRVVTNDRWSAWFALVLKLHELGDSRVALTEMARFVETVVEHGDERLAARLRRYHAVLSSVAGAREEAMALLADDPDFAAVFRGEAADVDAEDDAYFGLVLDFQPSPGELWRELNRESSNRVDVLGDSAGLVLPTGETVDLESRYVLRRLFRALLEARRESAGAALTLDDLMQAGWPDESMTYESGTRRVYSAIRNLRKLGLEEIVLTAEDGYLLSPDVEFANR